MRNRRKKITIRKDTTAKRRKATKKKASTRKSRVPRTRNAGTLTECAFWQMIRSALRQKSRFWKPILQVKNAAKRPYVGTNKRQKFEYKCSRCEDYYPEKMVSVHHIEHAGTLTCYADLPGFVERLFCEKEGLELLCDNCHKQEHKKEAA